jgi:N-acetyl-gamma-glutamyl-phosphate reductase common form
MSARTPAFVLGGSGYVAGELLRLIAAHPRLAIAGVMSDSKPGAAVADAFPHLQPTLPELLFAGVDEIGERLERCAESALFSAAPHGASAALVDALLTRAQQAGARVHAVDCSADFRHARAEDYERIYVHAHGAPARLADFTCALPEHLRDLRTPHVAHPGCFATAMLLAVVPLLASGLVEPRLYASGVTGSTGSGRKPVEGTHHPRRHGDLYAYQPLAHRHAPEVVACARAATGVETELAFVPHSGPFARGIHVTLQARLSRTAQAADVLDALGDYYAHSAFVRVQREPPRIKDVACSNYARLSAAADGRTVAVSCVIDNLVKGAAGGALQWMNRMLGLDEATGLTAPAPGWT